MSSKDELLKDRRVQVRVAGTKVWARVLKWVKPKRKMCKAKPRRWRKNKRVAHGLAKAKPRNWKQVLRQKSKAAKLARRAHR